MTKREFIIQYVMNRALGNTGGLDPVHVSREAAKAWDVINELAPLHPQASSKRIIGGIGSNGGGPPLV